MAKPIIALIFDKRLCECPGDTLEWHPYLGGAEIWGISITCTNCKMAHKITRSEFDTGVEYMSKKIKPIPLKESELTRIPVAHSKEFTKYDLTWLRSIKIKAE